MEVTLQQEIEFLNGYLEIERIRFQDRLTEIHVDPEVLDACAKSHSATYSSGVQCDTQLQTVFQEESRLLPYLAMELRIEVRTDPAFQQYEDLLRVKEAVLAWQTLVHDL